MRLLRLDLDFYFVGCSFQSKICEYYRSEAWALKYIQNPGWTSEFRKTWNWLQSVTLQIAGDCSIIWDTTPLMFVSSTFKATNMYWWVTCIKVVFPLHQSSPNSKLGSTFKKVLICADPGVPGRVYLSDGCCNFITTNNCTTTNSLRCNLSLKFQPKFGLVLERQSSITYYGSNETKPNRSVCSNTLIKEYY